MAVLEKFIELVKIDSPSDPASPTCPSTAMQLDVANYLERVMKEMGVSNVRQKDGYVYGEIPATPGYEDKTAVGFIAHTDTAPEFNGIAEMYCWLAAATFSRPRISRRCWATRVTPW